MNATKKNDNVEADLRKINQIALKERLLIRKYRGIQQNINRLKDEGYLRSQIVLISHRPESKLPDSYRPRSSEKSAKIRKAVLEVLLSQGAFHLDDLENTVYPDAKDIIKSIVDRGIMVKIGQRRNKNKQLSNIYKLVDREKAERLNKSTQLEIFAESSVKFGWITRDEVRRFYNQWFEPPFKKID